MTSGDRVSLAGPTERPQERGAPGGRRLASAPGLDRPAGLLTKAQPAVGANLLESIDLFLDAPALAAILDKALTAQLWFDAYVSAVGIQQIVADQCGSAATTLRRAARHLDRGGTPVMRAGAHLAAAASRVSVPTLRGRGEAVSRTELADELRSLIDDLATLSAGLAAGAHPSCVERAKRVAALTEALAPQLRDDVLRIPSSFHSFDQHPADMVELGRRVATAHGIARPLGVVGIRTSGSYLGPLLAAGLRAAGTSTVSTFTVRPGWPLSDAERHEMGALVAAGGLLVLVDDPPITGGALVSTIRQIEREAGVGTDAIVLALATFGEDVALSSALEAVARVELPYRAWDIHRRLSAPALTELVHAAFAGREVLKVTVPETPEPNRGHTRVTVIVTWRDGETTREEAVVAEGIGLGIFAAPARWIPGRVPNLYPTPLAYDDGVLVREALPAERRWSGGATTHDAAAVAAHLAARHEALAAQRDPSIRFAGRQAAHEIAAREVSRGLGPLAETLGPVTAGPVVRRLLATTDPVIVDADLWRTNWFRSEDGAMRKVGYAEGPFSHHDLASYDGAFDVVGAAVAVGDPEFSAALRVAYEHAKGMAITPERWALLELVHLWNGRRLGRIDSVETARRRSSVLLRFFADLYLRDVARPFAGDYCAFDVDGVLEGGALGFPAMSEASARTVRAVRAHGMRPLLASGRSLTELVERCAVLGLEGAVAEYGAVAYDANTGTRIELLSPAAQAAMSRLRNAVEAVGQIACDPAYAYILRCVPLADGRPSRRPLAPETAQQLLEKSGTLGSLSAIHGTFQTDFVPVDVDKGTGLRALLAHLGVAPASTPLAFAVGDGIPDAPMLRLARRAFVPAHAPAALGRPGVEVTTHAYEAGAAEAVGRILGHRPGACALCRPPELGRDLAALVALVSLHEAGRTGIPVRLARLARAARRGRRSSNGEQERCA